jgi:hypothetical protein
MKPQTPTSAAGERRYVRRVSAAIAQRRDASLRRRRGRFSTGIEQRPGRARQAPARELRRRLHGEQMIRLSLVTPTTSL